MKKSVVLAAAAALSACATVSPPPAVETGGVPQAAQQQAQERTLTAAPDTRELKRRIAVGRFTNVTRYGRSLLGVAESDPIENQAADIMTNRLVETGRFVVFDRPSVSLATDLNAIDASGANLVGVEAIVVGAVTQFGRRDEGRSGFLSSTRNQIVEATVEARLVDTRTGRVFFTASGSGQASTEQGEIAGFGSRAAYDATLNDKAIDAAISDLMNEVVGRLTARRWSTDVIDVRGDQTVLIAGGPAMGIRAGDRFSVSTRGETRISPSTGSAIELPGEQIAVIEVESFFGNDEQSQGSIARIVSGRAPLPGNFADYRVEEAH